MVTYISASYVCPVTTSPIENGVIGIDQNGQVIVVLTADEAVEQGVTEVIRYEGMLVPGFVNTHCHLELSHLKGLIAEHTGLVDFVQSVMKIRSADEQSIELAMERADNEMFNKGIAAVADISNQPISRRIKANSKIYYHTLVETMGFNPATAGQALSRTLDVKAGFAPLPASLVPHAPYSVSEALFDEIRLHADLVSIHNQETADENAFFKDKTGKFLELYQFLGLNIDFYQPSGKTSLQTYLPLLSPDLKTLLVHNTFTAKEDVAFAEAVHPRLYWCLCPGANLYIENRLPDVTMLRNAGVRITLGTDSLASNHELNILAEMKVLQKAFELPVDELLKWATLNGAMYMGVEDRFGSLEKGKSPGINLVEYNMTNGKLVFGDQLKRLF